MPCAALPLQRSPFIDLKVRLHCPAAAPSGQHGASRAGWWQRGGDSRDALSCSHWKVPAWAASYPCIQASRSVLALFFRGEAEIKGPEPHPAPSAPLPGHAETWGSSLLAQLCSHPSCPSPTGFLPIKLGIQTAGRLDRQSVCPSAHWDLLGCRGLVQELGSSCRWVARGHGELQKMPGDYLSAGDYLSPGEGPGLKEMPAEGAERVPHLQPSIAAGWGSSSPWDLVLVAARVPLQQLPPCPTHGPRLTRFWPPTAPWGGTVAPWHPACHRHHEGDLLGTAELGRSPCRAGTLVQPGCPTGSDAPSEGAWTPSVCCAAAEGAARAAATPNSAKAGGEALLGMEDAALGAGKLSPALADGDMSRAPCAAGPGAPGLGGVRAGGSGQGSLCREQVRASYCSLSNLRRFPSSLFTVLEFPQLILTAAGWAVTSAGGGEAQKPGEASSVTPGVTSGTRWDKAIAPRAWHLLPAALRASRG